MERFSSQRENVLLGYSPQRSLGSQSSSTKAPARDADVDFNDVFGGPPRRASAGEVRSSFGDTASTSSGARGEDDRASPRNPWTGLSEMPVFGEESLNRRRYPSDDFYDDIFRGDATVNSPRRSGWDTPQSSTSLPAQFQLSLVEKSTKATDYPAYSPGNHSPRTHKDPSSSGTSPPFTSKSSLSRTLSAALLEEELGNNIQPSYRPSPLSHEHSHESMGSGYIEKSEEFEPPDLKKDLKSTEALKDSYQFHFSIYKWASKGVPFSMPLRSSNLKGAVKMERCSTYSGRIASENMASGLQKAIWGDESHDPNFLNHSISTSEDAPNVEGRKLGNKSFVKASKEVTDKHGRTIEEAINSFPESQFSSNILKSDASPDNSISSEKMEETNTHSLSEKGLSKSSEKGVATNVQTKNKKGEGAKMASLSEILFSGSRKKGVDMTTEGAQEPEFKPLRTDEQGGDKTTGKTEAKDQMAKNTAIPHSNSDVKRSVNKTKEKRAASNKVEVNQVDEPLPRGSSRKSVDSRARNRDKGKVKDFVKIFNQEAPSEPKPETGSQSQRSQWKGTGTSRGDREETANTTQTNRKPHVDNLDEMKPSPNPPIKVAKNLESENQQSNFKTTGFKLDKNVSDQKDAAESSSKPLPDGPTVIIEDIDDILEENFTIKEITSNDQDKKPESEEGYEDIKTLDAKIQKWSNGKKGNIRSLLSTLQQVLWPGSGWKPVPLVGIIEGNGVKRAYQRAMLCLHPDKLQQKGAASHQKYIAEKVFDILQEAWDHFNSLGAI